MSNEQEYWLVLILFVLAVLWALHELWIHFVEWRVGVYEARENAAMMHIVDGRTARASKREMDRRTKAWSRAHDKAAEANRFYYG